MKLRLHPVVELFPEMEPGDFIALRDDIRQHGQREPITIHDGLVIDGRHRLRACEELGVQPRTREWDGRGSLVQYVVSLNMKRRDLTQSQKATISLEIMPLLEQEARERQLATLKQNAGADVAQMPPRDEPRNARDDAAAAFGVSPRYVQDAKAIQRDAPDLLSEVKAGEKTLTQAKRELKERKREERREENRVLVAQAPAPELVRAKFATIVIDPPWDFTEEGDQDVYGRTRPTYAQMSERQLAALPFSDLADEDCHLYLWITNRSLMTGKGWRLCEAWGFRPVTLLTWCKPSIGVGNYFRNNTEHLLFAVRGSQPLKRRDMGTWFSAPRGPDGHSSKPDEAYALIESCSPGPYLDMFARRPRDGWTIWGAEANAA